MNSCPHCGEPLPRVVDAFCPDCRRPLDEPPPTPGGEDHGPKSGGDSVRNLQEIFLVVVGMMGLFRGAWMFVRGNTIEAVVSAIVGIGFVVAGVQLSGRSKQT